ncbi:MAG: Rrf2 family transcriptional regulator [bacterium]|nr:Rrf2 family transcriptional regulator [bacterium]
MNQNSIDYVIRSLVYLGSLPASQYASGNEIAKHIDVSSSYLNKLLHSLVRVGILKSTTGPGGGFSLGRPPQKIHLLEAIEAVEGTVRLRDECILGLSECSDRNPCPFHSDWVKHRKTLLKQFQNTTLAKAFEKGAWPSYQASPGKS